MFNDIYQVDLPESVSIGDHKSRVFIVKANVLGTEVYVPFKKGGVRYLLAELNDEFRALVLELNELNKEKI